jgi:periplasmic copper chaperone A
MHDTSARSPRTSRPARSRRRLLIPAGLVVGAALALAAPLAASAHVEVSPDSAPAGGTSRLTFQFHHGCDDSPTTSLVVTIPAGVGNAMPVYEGGWTIQRTLGSNGVPTSITYTATHPIDTGVSAGVSMDVLFDTKDAGDTVAFPVLQTCVTGSTSWTQVPKEGQDESELDTPAPAVAVGPVGAGDEDDDDDATPSPSATAAPTAQAATSSAADPVARWLAGGGLVLAAAALVVTLVRRRGSRID